MPSRTTALRSVALALLLVLAGCGSIVGNDAADPGTPFAGPEHTPTDLATARTTTPQPSYGDLDPDAVQRHVAALDGRSVTVRWRGKQVRDESVVSVSAVGRIGPDDAVSTVARNGDITSETYAADHEVYNRRSRDGEVEYAHQHFDEDFTTPHDQFLRTLRAVLPVGNWRDRGSVDLVSGGSGTRYTGTIPGRTSDRLPDHRLTATLLVGDDGLIRELILRYPMETPHGTETVRRTVAISDVGSTTVAEPSWLSRAKNASDGGTVTDGGRTVTPTPETPTPVTATPDSTTVTVTPTVATTPAASD